MPKFKIGDEVRNRDPEFKGSAVITDIKNDKYYYKDTKGYKNSWDINTLEDNCRKLTKLEKALK